ncbi:glycosyltransferase [Herbaspirillum huttiense]|uniref:glycosyltransferase family 2 protein n=1 Tax=Herbaspirillum huttiense TaxID=863372 RepID=UPI001066ADBC|nr:glycosyltransferase family 2 protein [Herbaspirillum huttiense]QBP75430.1 glycosyltransferase [Herbaspirillum huttiense]
MIKKEISDFSVAILVPCYNEAATIGKVVSDFKRALPSAQVYVYDNNSKDGTGEKALAAGASVFPELLQGKGNVVRRMFSDVDADIYVLVDGDDTYDAQVAPQMIRQLIDKNLDCVNGVRHSNALAAYRQGHEFGNWLLTTIVSRLFGRVTKDMLTGYRVFSHRFVKSFPVVSTGFEIETEITVHSLELRMRSEDFETNYGARPEGSHSKLSTYKDGLKILWMIIKLVKLERPSLLFNTFAAITAFLSIGFLIPVLVQYFETGLVPRLPTAILAGLLMSLAILSVICGLILASVTQGRREAKQLAFLATTRYSSGG